MRPLPRIALLALTTATFLGVAEISVAEFGVERRGEFRDAPLAHKGDQIPEPNMRRHLPTSVPAGDNSKTFGGTCPTADDVFAAFLLDIENVGGEVVIMAEGVQQDFADSWRSLTAETRVEISLVMAHLIPDAGGDPIVDLVEIDGEGCLHSRTLMTEADWLALINLAHSVEV